MAGPRFSILLYVLGVGGILFSLVRTFYRLGKLRAERDRKRPGWDRTPADPVIQGAEDKRDQGKAS